MDVLVATVPWRKASCDRLLEQIAEQDELPERVHLLLDGFSDDDPYPFRPSSLTVSITHYDTAQGAGNRWRYVSQMPWQPDVLINLDDDTVIPKGFTRRMADEVRKTGDAVCASGYPREGGIYLIKDPHTCEVVCVQTGFFACRTEALRGIDRQPQAEKFLGLLGDDEAFVSAHLWKNHVKMRKIWIPNLNFDKLSRDRRSQFRRKGGTIEGCHAHRAELGRIFGWPVPPLEPL